MSNARTMCHVHTPVKVVQVQFCHNICHLVEKAIEYYEVNRFNYMSVTAKQNCCKATYSNVGLNVDLYLALSRVNLACIKRSYMTSVLRVIFELYRLSYDPIRLEIVSMYGGDL